MELYLGGYFIVRNNSSYTNSYIPYNYFSASECMLDILPDTWAWNKALSKKERQWIKERHNLTDKQVDSIREYTWSLIEDNEFQLPYVFPSVEIADKFYNQHFTHIKNVKILGISTTKHYSDEFLLEVGKDEFGVSINLSLSKSIDPTGKFIGYDLLGYEYWGFHSMYCHKDLLVYCNNELNIYFNDYGLIETLDEAVRAINIIREEKVWAEPALWQPWAIHEFKTY